MVYDGYLGTLFTSEVSGGCAATLHIGSTCHINWANLLIIIVLRGATMCGNTRKHIRNDHQEIYSELMYQIMLQCHDMIWRHRFVTLSSNDPYMEWNKGSSWHLYKLLHLCMHSNSVNYAAQGSQVAFMWSSLAGHWAFADSIFIAAKAGPE